jgi:hypothetical protein
MHEAANNWGNAYLHQYQALREVDADEAVRCLDQAERILLQAEGMQENSLPTTSPASRLCVAMWMRPWLG